MFPGKVRPAIVCLWIELVSLVLGIFLLAGLMVLVQQLNLWDVSTLGELDAVQRMMVWGVVAFAILYTIGMTIWHHLVIQGLQKGQSSAWLQGCILFGLSILQGNLITGILGLIYLLDPEVRDFYHGKTPAGHMSQEEVWPGP
ncbi:hypothetical protein [Deinococcus roseus]|nr:hypothetical protein [Deinococcus roseus]